MGDVRTRPIPYGTLVQMGRRVYGRCYDCGELVRVDKPLLGSLHLCVTDEEAERRRQPVMDPPKPGDLLVIQMPDGSTKHWVMPNPSDEGGG